MSAKAAIKLYITVIVIILALSAYFLIRDFRSGALFRDRVNFDRMSFFDGKQACDAALVEGCIPNPITLIFHRSKNAQAAAIVEETKLEDTNQTETQASTTVAEPQSPKPRFSN